MISSFLEGEVYSHPKKDNYIMVLGIKDQTNVSSELAVLWVDPESLETVGYGELTVPQDQVSDWTLVKL